MQEHTEYKNSNLPTRLLLLSLAVVITLSIVCLLLPRVKGLWQTATAAVGLNETVSLTAISFSQDNPLAIVDGQIVHEQDVVGGVKVVKIHKDEVEFESSGRRWTQRLPAAEQGISSGLPVMLQLSSPTCPPCVRMNPILDELKTKYRAKFRLWHIDVTKNPAAASKYGIRGTPTQIFLDSQGTEVFRHVGFYSKKDILATWRELGVKL
jgi:thioredoxin 1